MMTLEEFTKIISEMLGTTKWNDQMEMLFHKVRFIFCKTYLVFPSLIFETNTCQQIIPFKTSGFQQRFRQYSPGVSQVYNLELGSSKLAIN